MLRAPDEARSDMNAPETKIPAQKTTQPKLTPSCPVSLLTQTTQPTSTQPGEEDHLTQTTQADWTPQDGVLLLDLVGVRRRVFVAVPTLYGWMAQGTFPRPIKVGRASRWLASEVDAWVAERIAARGPALKAKERAHDE